MSVHNFTFHNEELTKDCRENNIVEDSLKKQCIQDVNEDNISFSSNTLRRKMRNLLEDNGVRCDRESRACIKSKLLELLCRESDKDRVAQVLSPLTLANDPYNYPGEFSLIFPDTVIKSMLGHTRDHFSIPIERSFFQDCEALEVPIHHGKQVMHTML